MIMVTHLSRVAAGGSAPTLDDRETQMQTAISRGLRHAHRSSTRSGRVLKNNRVGLHSTQHMRCLRTYSSMPSPGDRDKTAVGVSPPRHSN